MASENFSIGAFYDITKNQDNPIKTVRRDGHLAVNQYLEIYFYKSGKIPVMQKILEMQ